jgi:hypothetical protein
MNKIFKGFRKTNWLSVLLIIFSSCTTPYNCYISNRTNENIVISYKHFSDYYMVGFQNNQQASEKHDVALMKKNPICGRCIFHSDSSSVSVILPPGDSVIISTLHYFYHPVVIPAISELRVNAGLISMHSFNLISYFSINEGVFQNDQLVIDSTILNSYSEKTEIDSLYIGKGGWLKKHNDTIIYNDGQGYITSFIRQQIIKNK